MKALTASVLSLALLMGCWGLFYCYSVQNLSDMINTCDQVIMPAVEEENWKAAEEAFRLQNENWHRYRNAALFFLDTRDINDADSTFAKTLMYIKAEDLSNSSGELLSLREQLKYLRESERICLRNIL
ncbi:MAG: DUF4363 family protein [Emergencia sp.]|nr:DUF4363 family protein [Emergencia sp.]